MPVGLRRAAQTGPQKELLISSLTCLQNIVLYQRRQLDLIWQGYHSLEFQEVKYLPILYSISMNNSKYSGKALKIRSKKIY